MTKIRDSHNNIKSASSCYLDLNYLFMNQMLSVQNLLLLSPRFYVKRTKQSVHDYVSSLYKKHETFIEKDSERN